MVEMRPLLISSMTEILKSKLQLLKDEEEAKKYSDERKGQIGTSDRSEKIRTYNFPQGRVTDHRINLTLYKIDAIMDGDMEELLTALNTEHQAEQQRGRDQQHRGT